MLKKLWISLLWSLCIPSMDAWATGAQRLPSPPALPFDQHTWAQISQVRQPTAIVFSATYCAHCPGVIKQLAAQQRNQPQRFKLIIVTIDADAATPPEPPHSSDYQQYYFDGNAQAIRYAINPHWRGVTPYIVLLRPGHPAVFITGMPSEQHMKAFAP